MVLGKSALRGELRTGRLKVEPFDDELLQPASIDMRLGEQFLVPEPSAGSLTRFGESIPYQEIRTGSYMLPGNSFVLARTREVVQLPDDLTAFVEGRSSIGRLGLFIQNAGWVDPGFRGSITLELYNGLPHPIELRAGWRVCQLVFVRMEGSSEGGYTGKYQGQVDTTGSRLHQDADGASTGNG
jgi:dCTP deaminase